jgi:hypothetical protein
VFFIAGSSDAAEPSGEFYQWTLPNGDVMMTDDAKRIPAMYKDIVVKRSFAQVGKDAKVTEMTIPGVEYHAALEASLERARKTAARTATNPRVEGCEGPITVSQERRDYEERGNSYNSLFYIVSDSCGNVVSETRNAPIPLIRVE